MAHEASDSPNKETDVHPQYGDNTSFNGENIHQGVGNNYNIKNFYQNNKSVSPIRKDEIEKWCSETKELLRKKYSEKQSNNLSTSAVQLGLRMRHSNKFGLEFKNNREDVASALCKELDTDIDIDQLFVKAKDFADQAKRKLKKKEHQENFVGLVGGAKVGKTTLAKKIIEHLLNPVQFDYIFYINLNNISMSKKTDFLKFLLPPTLPWMKYEHNRIAVFEKIVEHPENICLILDDLDVDKLEPILSDFSTLGWFEDEPQTSKNIILNILKGNIFSKSKKILVSRHFELDKLPRDYRPAFVVNVVGLTRKEQEKVCKNYGQDLDTTFRKFQLLPDIHLLCAVPLNCEAFLELCGDSDSCFCNMFLTVLYQFLQEVQQNSRMLDLKILADFAWSQFVAEKEVESNVTETYFFDVSKFENNNIDKIYINSFFVTTFCENPLPHLKKFPILKSHFSCLLVHDYFVAIKLLSLDSICIDKFLSAVLNEMLENQKFSHQFVVIIFLCGLCNLNIRSLSKNIFNKLCFPNCQEQKLKSSLNNFLRKLEVSPQDSNSNFNIEIINFIIDCEKELFFALPL